MLLVLFIQDGSMFSEEGYDYPLKELNHFCELGLAFPPKSLYGIILIQVGIGINCQLLNLAMSQSQIELLQQMIRNKKARVSELDDKLFQQIAKQKVIQQLMGDYDSSQSESVESSSYKQNRNINQSFSSGISYDTQFIEDEIDKVKNFMKKIRKEQSEPQRKQNKNLFVKKQQKIIEPTNQTDIFNLKTQKEEIKYRLIDQELKILPQKEEIQYIPEKTIYKKNNYHKIQAIAALKYHFRQEELKQERQMIRKQLLQERKQKKSKQQKQRQNFIQAKHIMHQYHHIKSYDQNSILKVEREAKISSLLRQINHGKKKIQSTKNKIRQLSFYS